MPLLSRRMIHGAFFNLWCGFGIATLLMVWKGKPDLLPAAIGGWLLVHVDLLLVGWMVQLAMGVAYWILPRLPKTVTQRGRYGFALGAAVMLNIGVWGYSLATIAGWEWGQVLGLAAQLVAVCAYAIHIAPRIRSAIVTKTQA